MSTIRKRKQSTLTSPTSPNGRIFTDSDEVSLLKTFQKLTQATPSSSYSSPLNTTPAVDSPTFNRINSSLGSKFTHAQITRKLRILRIKYHKQARTKSLIKTSHDEELFKIAQDIWGKKTKKAQDVASSDGEEEEVVERNEEQEPEERVDLEEYPVLVSEFSKYFPMNMMWRETLKSIGSEKLREMNEKWMMIGIEEAKIVAKKADLVKEQAQLVMEVLGKTAANGNGLL